MPRYVAIPALVAMAFGHGGLWFQKDLAAVYCARCRRIIVSVAVVFATLALTAAALGVALLLKGPPSGR